MGFNRRCSADKTGPHAVSEFTCYELAPTTDFQSFLDKATPANLKCPDNETTATDDGLRFTYSATVESNISPSDHIDIDVGFNATKVFDEKHALTGTMYAKYKEILTEEPTTSPSSMPSLSPTKIPSETPSSPPTTIPSETPTGMPQSNPSIMPTPTPTAAAPN